jgi:hypothetical protein
MKKTVFIVGGVLALGAIAYLFLKNKKKQQAILGGANLATSSPTTGTPTTGVGASPTNAQTPPPLSTGGIVTSTTKAPTIEEQIKLDRANDIAETIKKYYGLSATRQLSISMWKPISTFSIEPINPYPAMISKLKDELLKLGYEYKGTRDGVLVKL